jgi:hypothetical protein
MSVDSPPYVAPLARLHRHFASRRHTGDRATWLAQAWARAVLVDPAADDAAVLALLDAEWAAFRARHPEEPAVTFRPPSEPPPDEVVPGPPPYDALPPLRHGRYGIDLPSHEDRIREEQERLARRDTAYYGF